MEWSGAWGFIYRPNQFGSDISCCTMTFNRITFLLSWVLFPCEPDNRRAKKSSKFKMISPHSGGGEIEFYILETFESLWPINFSGSRPHTPKYRSLNHSTRSRPYWAIGKNLIFPSMPSVFVVNLHSWD